MFLSCQEAQRALAEGSVGEEVLHRASNVGGFAGAMRTNLIAMLDGIGLHEHLEISTTASLFAEHSDLLHGTSAILYPAFIDGRNYGGSPHPDRFPLLAAFVNQVLAAELAEVPDAVYIPLGRTVADLLHRAAARGTIAAHRCLFDFPHPSGGNGHRRRLYDQHRSDMANQVASWAA